MTSGLLKFNQDILHSVYFSDNKVLRHLGIVLKLNSFKEGHG